MVVPARHPVVQTKPIVWTIAAGDEHPRPTGHRPARAESLFPPARAIPAYAADFFAEPEVAEPEPLPVTASATVTVAIGVIAVS